MSGTRPSRNLGIKIERTQNWMIAIAVAAVSLILAPNIAQTKQKPVSFDEHPRKTHLLVGVSAVIPAFGSEWVPNFYHTILYDGMGKMLEVGLLKQGSRRTQFALRLGLITFGATGYTTPNNLLWHTTDTYVSGGSLRIIQFLGEPRFRVFSSENSKLFLSCGVGFVGFWNEDVKSHAYNPWDDSVHTFISEIRPRANFLLSTGICLQVGALSLETRFISIITPIGRGYIPFTLTIRL